MDNNTNNQTPAQQTQGNVQFQSSLPTEDEIEKIKKKKKLTIILFSFVVLLIIAGIGIYLFIANNGFHSAKHIGIRKISINMWGISQPESTYAPLIAQFEKANPGLTIN
jgi:flagellar basal body-associated protein FliL